MRQLAIWTLVMAAGLTLASCRKEQAPPSKAQAEANWEQARADYIAAIERDKIAVDRQIDLWEAKLDTAPADKRDDYRERIRDLKRKRDKLDDQLKELRQAGQDKWERARDDVDEAWHDLKDAFENNKVVIHIET